MMDNNEMQLLKRMGKSELIEVIQKSDDENYQLKQDADKKDQRIKELETQLSEMQEKQNNTERSKEPGSIAEEIVEITGLMQAAQNTANQYIERIRRLEEEKQAELDTMTAQAKRKAEQIIEKANEDAEKVQKASADVLKNLQEQMDKMLTSVRGEYKSLGSQAGIHDAAPGASAEEKIDTDTDDKTKSNLESEIDTAFNNYVNTLKYSNND